MVTSPHMNSNWIRRNMKYIVFFAYSSSFLIKFYPFCMFKGFEAIVAVMSVEKMQLQFHLYTYYSILTCMFWTCLLKVSCEQLFEWTMQLLNIPNKSNIVLQVYKVELKKSPHLKGYEIKSINQIFTTKMLIFQSKADLNEKILLVTSHICKTKQLQKCL